MKALLVYPEYPPLTYWSFSRTMPYIGRRAAHPPLGLVTVAALLPGTWELRLVDMNVGPLTDADLVWADVVLASAMVVQAPSLEDVVARCNRIGVPIAVGGPYPSGSPHRLRGVDHLFVGEAEDAIAELVDDLEHGRAKPRYDAAGLPDVDASPIPRFDLLDLGAYASMSVQHSRGCPFSCEFCDIWKLYGRRPRVKSPDRLLAELDALYATGWRGSTFFVDDNFIGSPKIAKRSLAAIEGWQRERAFPFQLYTEASVNLGSDDELLAAMRDAGFSFVFLGIETPSVESLRGAHKGQNAKVDLLETVRRIQAHGIEVSSGFIVGFDEDTDDVFDRQIEFIREAAIPMAMVGILTAIEGTELYDRLKREGRLLAESVGDNTHRFDANFVPRMPRERLVDGYKRVMESLYDPTLAAYFERCRRLLDRLGPNPSFTRRIVPHEVAALLRSLATIPTRRFGRQYLLFLLWSLARHPGRFPEAVRLAIMGFHFEAITREALSSDGVRRESARLADLFRARFARLAEEMRRSPAAARERVRTLIEDRSERLERLERQIRRLAPDARGAAAGAYAELLQTVDDLFAEHAPSPARAVTAGARRLAALRASWAREVDAVRARYAAARARAGDRLDALERDIDDIRRAKRALLARARRRVRRLPNEYRLLGRLELAALRRRLVEFTASPGLAGAR